MGAAKYLNQCRPIVYGEFMAHCLGWHGQTIEDVETYLKPLSYKVFARRDGWRFAPLSSPAPFVQDALCVPTEAVDRMRESVLS